MLTITMVYECVVVTEVQKALNSDLLVIDENRLQCGSMPVCTKCLYVAKSVPLCVRIGIYVGQSNDPQSWC